MKISMQMNRDEKFDVDESDLQMTNMNFENEINTQIKTYFQEWN